MMLIGLNNMPTQLTVRRMYIDRMLFLMTLGHVMPVLSFLQEACSSSDVSLITYAVAEVS